jgi:hypothetical protein
LPEPVFWVYGAVVQIVMKLFAMLWSMLQQMFAPLLGPFFRAVSLRRSDDGSGP